MANLNDLIDSINFSTKRRIEVNQALKNLAGTITTKSEEDEIPTAKLFRLIGSIDRKTKIDPLDDVDILYVMGSGIKNDEGKYILKEWSFRFHQTDVSTDNGNISSLLLLNQLKKSIADTYSTSEIKRNNEVVNVYLSSYKVGFDIVPAFDITNTKYYLIPEGGGRHNWKRTNPIQATILYDELNKKTNGVMRNVSKIIKYWLKHKSVVSPYSYHVESIIYHIFNDCKDEINYTREGLEMVLKFINYKNHLKSCPDFTGIGENLTKNLTEDEISKIVEKAKELRTMLLSNEDEFVKYLNPDIQ